MLSTKPQHFVPMHEAGPPPYASASRGVHGASQPRAVGPAPGDDVFRASGPRAASPAPGEDRRPIMPTTMPSAPGMSMGMGQAMDVPKAMQGGAPSLGVPRLSIQENVAAAAPPQRVIAPGPPDVHLGKECESEIDRLVRERLEGGHTDRVNAKRRIEGIADYHNTWQGCMEASLRECAWSILQAPQVLLGRLSLTGPESACSRMAKVVPVVIQADGTTDDVADVNAPPPETLQASDDEDFQDLISPPAALGVRELQRPASPRPIDSSPPASSSTAAAPIRSPEERIPPAHAPASPRVDVASSRSPAIEEASGSARAPQRSGRRPGDTASALSVSSAMTSSAAQVLGGLAQPKKRSAAAAPSSARPEPVAEEPSSAASSSEAYPTEEAKKKHSPGKERRSNESKSVLASNAGMTSSAAAALGSLSAGGSRRGDGGSARTKSSSPRGGKSPRDAKSTLAPTTTSSAAASALEGASARGSGGRSSSSGRRPGGDSKTVVSGLGTSSAASALLGPLAQAQRSQGSTKRRSADDAKSVM